MCFLATPANSGDWTECAPGHIPDDRRFVIATNAFPFAPNNAKKIAMALIIQPHAEGCPNNNFTTIKSMADSAWYYYYHPPIFPTGIENILTTSRLKVYPNPVHSSFFIETGKQIMNDYEVDVFDVSGREIPVAIFTKNNLLEINTEPLSKGFYTISYKDNKQTQ